MMYKWMFVVVSIILTSFISNSIQELPLVNQKVIEFCESKMNKKVDRGECWDLASHALNYANAQWSYPYNFGQKVDYQKDNILGGDIIQFEKVKIVFPNSSYEEYPHHTAIVYKVLANGKYLIFHQNANGVKKVKTQELDLNYMKKGKIQFYRPQAK